MIRKTLSISDKQEEFLKDNPDLSPSKMLQSKIIEIQENRRINYGEIERWRNKFSRLSEMYRKLLAEKEKLENDKSIQ